MLKWTWILLGCAIVAFLIGAVDFAGVGVGAFPVGIGFAILALLTFVYAVFKQGQNAHM